MMPARSVSSAKFSAEHLKESQTFAGSRTVTAKIFPLILKVRSMPQVTCSVARGNDRQRSRTKSTSAFMGRSVGEIMVVGKVLTMAGDYRRGLVDADIFVPNGGIFADVGGQEVDAFGGVEVDDLDAVFAEPVDGPAEIDGFAGDYGVGGELGGEAAASPARAERSDPQFVAIGALATGAAEGVGFWVDGGIVLLDAGVSGAAPQAFP